MRTDIAEREQEIRQWITEGQSHAFIARELGCKVDTLKAWFIRLKIEYAGNQGRKGDTIGREGSTYVPVEFYLKKNGPFIQGTKLKKKLFREGLKEKYCEQCGISKWQEKPAPLQIDHIDGDRWNNELKNLRILCANCHAQTPTHGGRNIGGRRQKMRHQG